MTDFEQWCDRPVMNNVDKHAYVNLVSNDDAAGISAVSATLGQKYAEVDMLVHIAEQFGKHGRNFSRWMSPVGVKRLSCRSPGWCPGLVG
jgi:hypothetical protein